MSKRARHLDAGHGLTRVVTVTPLLNFRVRVKLTDGSRRVLDLRPLLRGPFFKPLLDDPELFKQVTVVHGTLSWPTGQDLDPDVLLETSLARQNPGKIPPP